MVSSSFTARGRPSSARVRAPRAYFASALRAASRARSQKDWLMALIAGAVASARAMAASISSTGESFFALKSASASTAPR